MRNHPISDQSEGRGEGRGGGKTAGRLLRVIESMAKGPTSSSMFR